MSIIQNIRDKAAWIIIGAIALALIAFIVQDAFQNRSLFGSDSTVLGKVNGTTVDAVEFEKHYQQAEAQYRNAGYPLNEMMKENIRKSLWDEYVEKAILGERYEELGIQVTDKELGDILYGANPPQDLRQQFTDPKTGIYDANAAYAQIEQIRKQKNTPMYQSFFNQYLPALRTSRQREKYLSLLSSSAYVPKWMVERMNAENSQQASISFVAVPYTTISDSAVQVTDEDVKNYVAEHKDEYQQEESRSIEYVMFDAAPTAGDSAAVLQQVTALRDEFATTTDPVSFLQRNASETPYYDAFIQGSKLQLQNADTIRQLGEGVVYGPYVDGGNYVMAKMIAKRSLPDSAKVRHILIKTTENGQPLLADSLAKKRIDSVVAAIRSGANFDSMVVKFSDDEGSRDKGGEYTFSSLQFADISKEFAEAIFYGNVGDKKTVRVENARYSGYHYIEVLEQKNFETAYKVAYLARPILPSDETVNNAEGLASQFAAESRDRKAFTENAKKRKLNVFTAGEVKPLESMITGVGPSRELVRWMYEAKVGQVGERPFSVTDKYVVPVLTAVMKEGDMSVAVARPLVESTIRNKKKAEQISKKIGTANTLEAAAQATGQTVAKADSVQFANPFIANIGQEAKVVGAAFDKATLNKVSKPIEGNLGVFVIRTENVSAVANPNFDVIQQQAAMLQFQQRGMSDPRLLLDILKKSATIKDNRHKFF